MLDNRTGLVEVEVDKVCMFQWFLQIAGRVQKIL
jgi:hypothetical protein